MPEPDVKTIGVTSETGDHEDKSGVYPLYGSNHSVNLQARGGGQQYKLNSATSAEDLPIDLNKPNPSQYPLNQVSVSGSGHVIEVNDTADGQRILIKHNNGGGIELRDDGSILVSAMEQKVELIGAQHHIVVEGDGTMVYKGNLNLKVNGDFNVDCLNYNLNVKGNKTENVKGSDRSTVGGSKGTTVTKSMSTTVIEQVTDTFLNGHSHNVKGIHSMNIDGTANYFASGNMNISSEYEMNMSSEKLRAWSNQLVVMGGGGIIGGTEMIYSGKGAQFVEGVTAPTFHGDLTGRADEAIASDTAIYASYGGGPGSAAGWTNTNTATPSIASVSSTNISNYLTLTANAIKKVRIDVGDFIKNFINKSKDYGGVSETPLNTGQARSKLRDPSNLNNSDFVSSMVKEGTIGECYNNPTPEGIGRIIKDDPTPQTSVGVGLPVNPSSAYIPSKSEIKIYPDEKYNPYKQNSITSETLLAPGISMAKFLGSDDPTNLNFIRDLSVKRELAKYLGIHALNMKNILSNQTKFKNVTLKISESVYRPGPDEKITPNSLNDLKLKGRAVVFDVVGNSGRSNLTSLFDLAVWWKDIIYYEKMILSYDTLAPDCSLSGKIIVILPEIDQSYKAKFNRDIETHFNNKVFSKNEFTEILAIKPQDDLGDADYEIPSVEEGGRVRFLNPKPSSRPRQVIIDAIDKAVSSLGDGYTATCTYNGGRANRDGTINHPLGWAMDFYLSYNGKRLYPNNNKETYDNLIKALVDNARARKVRPGIGGYKSFIHYDESPWRQKGSGKAGTWNSGFRIRF